MCHVDFSDLEMTVCIEDAAGWWDDKYLLLDDIWDYGYF